MSPAEIIFEGYAGEKPHLVDYRAKWDENSYEYHHTPRRFDFGPEDRPLVDRLRTLTLECWRLFDLSGWARVDFRVDDHGDPWILEINSNPCLSRDAGFMAAAVRSGLSDTEVVNRIIEDVHGGKRAAA